MAQTSEGALKVAAKKSGLSVDEFRQRLASGLKRCTKCKTWKESSGYARDASRHDGKSSSCFQCNRVEARKSTKGRPSAFKGKTHSEDARAKISRAHLGKPSRRRGIKLSLEAREKISKETRAKALRGAEAPGYIDGKGVERRGLRHSAELKRWRYQVYLRDGFACAHCGDDRGGNLNAHHIRPFAKFPELRFDVRNGITLCEGCHGLAHQTCLWGYPQPAA